MDETGFIHNKNSHRVVVSKGYSNVLSKCADANFHPTSYRYVCSADRYVCATTV